MIQNDHVTISPQLTAYAAFVLAADPIWATECGLHTWDGTLGRVDAAHWEEYTAGLRRFGTELDALTCDDPTQRLDLRLSRVDVRHRLAELEHLRPWRRAPYLYVEQIGHALEGVLAHRSTDPERAAELLVGRLHDVPGYLADAAANLDPDLTPPEYVAQGQRATAGLADLLRSAVPSLGGSAPASLRRMCEVAAGRAGTALSGYETVLADLAGRARGGWAAGPEYVDHCLREYYLLDLDHESLYEWGLDQVEADRQALREYAARRDPDLPWPEQVARIRTHHTTPDKLLESYGGYVTQCREHTITHRLVAVPDGEECGLDWVPPYLRASLPMGVMEVAPVFSGSLRSMFRFTPIRTNPDGSPDEDHLRESCYAFMQAITGHETYPGHHLQRVHHKLATAGTESIRKVFSSPLFVEGWGLYVEDLMEETGQISEPETVLFKLRNCLWRSARVVVDAGLHTRGMSADEAVRYLMDTAALGRHIATGEVARYIRHDNPTYPSAYALGRAEFHRMRRAWRDRVGPDVPIDRFHNQVLGFGSMPHRLVEEELEHL